MEDSRGCKPSQIKEISFVSTTSDGTYSSIVEDLGKLSPQSQETMRLALQKVSTGEARLGLDAQGNPTFVYKNRRQVPILNYIDSSKSSTIVAPNSEIDLQNYLKVFLDLISFIKTNNAPCGVVIDKEKIRPTNTGQYREGEDNEYTKLKQILGTGTMAGDIVVVKDNKTGNEHAQKTVMISQFRDEELRAWIDLDEDGLCPSLYSFYLHENKLVFHMEKLETAMTLQDIIDNHMCLLRRKEPQLVRPFSLYMLHGLLSAVNIMHEKNWNHRDLHGGNLMVQSVGQKLVLKVLDFGKANPLYDLCRCPDSMDLRGEQDDIFQVVRLFTGLYLGQEFDSVYDLKQNYKQYLRQISHLSPEQKTEVYQMVEAVMSVAETGANIKGVISDVSAKLGGAAEIDNVMKRVVAILFTEDDYLPLHSDTTTRVECDGIHDDVDAPLNFNHRAHFVPDAFLQKLRLAVAIHVGVRR